MRALPTTGLAAALLPALAAAAEPQRHVAVPELLSGGAVAQMLFGLVLILALIVAGGWLLRRYTPVAGGKGAIQVVGALAVGSRERVVLIEVGGTRLLVGVAPGRVQTLHVLATDPAHASEAFAATLASVQKGEQRG